MVLELMGNAIRLAHDGESAIAAAEEFRPDVVFMDIGLPRLDGYEAARRIRAESWAQGMFLIAVTGWGQEEDKRRSADAGFDLHMVKPLDLDVLEDLLAKLHSRPAR
jgi:CheY-like chemotaxis protein